MTSENTLRFAFSNRTNASLLPTQPNERGFKRRASIDGGENNKRVKVLGTPNAKERENVVLHDCREVLPAKSEKRNNTAFCHLRAARMRPRGAFLNESLSTRRILTSFISSNKADVYRLHSDEDPLGPGVPFACAFSADAKKGGVPILAVAMQEGMIELLNVSKRDEWDFKPQRTRIHGHTNAILGIKWGFGDQTLATASADSTIRITSVSTHQSVAVLTHHKSSVKALDWDPNHADLLSTASRDGSICVWDLRTANNNNSSSGICPVVVIPHAHCDTIPRGNAAKRRSSPKTVTSLLYLPQNPRQLVSSGSFDGVLKQWDLRYPVTGRAKKPSLLLESMRVPTLGNGCRGRGVSDLAMGRNHSAGTIWGLATDSCVHAYSMPLLSSSSYSTSCNKLSHPGLYVKSFYIKLAVSPCGNWLACGSSGGGVYLWDVATRRPGPRNAVELKATGQEISAVDWAKDSLAACCDDGTVRMWRPNLEISSDCRADPQEKMWEWTWAKDDVTG